MDKKGKTISCQQARAVDMVAYLNSIGHHAQKVSGNNYWFSSPFRKERTPSFKVDRRINRWYDFGEGIGGNLIDFAIRYHHCSISSFLQALSAGSILPAPPQIATAVSGEENISIKKVGRLRAPGLLSYLQQRSIPTIIAEKYCQEVRYTLYGREYYAIGFENNLGGFELRNAFFKGSSSPKTITSIIIGSGKICVFEGFMDFLSFLSLNSPHKTQNSQSPNFIILNSLSFFENAIPLLLEHDAIHLYLDRDAAGRRSCLKALQLSEKFHDESYRYAAFKDLNDFHCKLRMIPQKLQKAKEPPP